MYPSQDADKYVLRFPPGLRERVKQSANVNHRSMNAEMIHHIEAGLGKAKSPAGIAVPPSHDQSPQPAKYGESDA